MQGTITQNINSMGVGERDKYALRNILSALGNDASQSLTSAGLVIKGAGNTVVKTGSSTWYGMVNGVLVSKAGSTDMAALSGTVTNAKFNVFCFYIDGAGTLSSQMGTEASTLAGVIFPATPSNKTMIGFVVINPTGTGNFVGGTTPLDDATVVPNAGYVSIVGSFDQTILL